MAVLMDSGDVRVGLVGTELGRRGDTNRAGHMFNITKRLIL